MKEVTRFLFAVLILFAPSVFAANGDSGPGVGEHSGKVYAGQPASIKRAVQAQEKALQQNKLLMVVLGANWCHDSRGFASKVQTSPVADQVNEQFEVMYADVGYLDDGFELAKHYGLPIYWATPMVMVIDPNTSTLLNRHDLVHWSNADSHSQQAYLDYFKAASFNDADQTLFTEHKAQIAQFSQAQSDRVKQGYDVVGPLLREYKESGEKASDEFVSKWGALRKLRIAVPEKLEALEKQAARYHQQNKNSPLALPVLPRLPWERASAE